MDSIPAQRRLEAINGHLITAADSSSQLRSNPTAGEFVYEQGYSVVLPEKLQTEKWNVYRSARSPLKLISRFPDHPDIGTLHDNFARSVDTFRDYKYLGTRIRVDGTAGDYKWMTYGEAGTARSAIGSGLINHGIPKGSCIGLYFINRPEWIIVDHACSAYSYISVPLYDTLGPDAVKYIVNHAVVQVIFCVLQTLNSVKWSYTYTRPGYTKKQHHSVPKDWWTEDVADLDIDLFRCIIMAIRSTYVLPPQLIGEALHVYACRWIPGIAKLKTSGSSVSQTEESKEKNRKILETIVSMIPADRGSVSIGFLLRLLNIANHLGVSPVTKAELIRRASLQFEEATVSDMLYPSTSASDRNLYDVDIIQTVLESFLKLWKKMTPAAVENSHFIRSIRSVAKLVDSYLQVVARDDDMPVSKFVSLAETVPDIARSDHDDLYKALSIYLKEHPELSKADKKRLCRILDCQKLSPELRSHAVKNELLPLRTVVQVLYFEQEKEKGTKATTSNKLPKPHEVLLGAKHRPATRESQGKQSLGANREELNKEVPIRTPLHETREKDQVRTTTIRADGKLPMELERKMVIRGDLEETRSEKGREFKGESKLGSKVDAKKTMRRERSKSDHGREKGRER